MAALNEQLRPRGSSGRSLPARQIVYLVFLWGVDSDAHKHAQVIVCYDLAILYGMFAPYLVGTLVVEFNNVFLHVRRLHGLAGYKRSAASSFYMGNLFLLIGMRGAHFDTLIATAFMLLNGYVTRISVFR